MRGCTPRSFCSGAGSGLRRNGSVGLTGCCADAVTVLSSGMRAMRKRAGFTLGILYRQRQRRLCEVAHEPRDFHPWVRGIHSTKFLPMTPDLPRREFLRLAGAGAAALAAPWSAVAAAPTKRP